MKFLAFEVTRADDHPANFPVAGLVRLSDDVLRRLNKAVSEVEKGPYKSLELSVKDEDVKWLSMLAFRKDGSVAPVEGWFDPDRDTLLAAEDFYNMDYEDGRVEFDEACTVYSGEPIRMSALEVESHQGKFYLYAGGETFSYWNIATNARDLSTIRADIALPESDSDSVVHVVFGEDAVRALENDLMPLYVAEAMETHEFATPEEAKAFIKGVDAACGWMEYAVPEPRQVEILKEILEVKRRQEQRG